jgi:uncharacterized protein YecE (DUF72 family)
MGEQMAEIFVGMGGWSLAAFENNFYPPNAGKEFRRLRYFSQFFDLVEVNATFYSTSFTPWNARRWIEEVSHNERFLFTVKLYQGFTHTMDATGRDVVSTHRLLEPLVVAGKLGGVVLQFAHSFVNTPDNRARLTQLSRTFKRYPLFVELRHDSWNQPEVLKFLQENGMKWINVDLPRIKRHVQLTSYIWDNVAYFRLMGRNAVGWTRGVQHRYNYFYSQQELEEIGEKIERVKPTAGKIFVVFHNDPHAHSLVNGFQLRRMVNEQETIVVPSSLAEKFPRLRELGTIQEVQPRTAPDKEASLPF